MDEEALIEKEYVGVTDDEVDCEKLRRPVLVELREKLTVGVGVSDTVLELLALREVDNDAELVRRKEKDSSAVEEREGVSEGVPLIELEIDVEEDALEDTDCVPEAQKLGESVPVTESEIVLVEDWLLLREFVTLYVAVKDLEGVAETERVRDTELVAQSVGLAETLAELEVLRETLRLVVREPDAQRDTEGEEEGHSESVAVAQALSELESDGEPETERVVNSDKEFTKLELLGRFEPEVDMVGVTLLLVLSEMEAESETEPVPLSVVLDDGEMDEDAE
jgi:hypothetical protein